MALKSFLARQKREALSSVGRKYSGGYFLILAFAVIVFICSFIGNQIVSASYSNAMDELLSIYRIYVEIEDLNRENDYIYLFVGSSSPETLEEKTQLARQTVAGIRKRNETKFSRNEIDLCHLVETYLEQAGELSALIPLYVKSHSLDNFNASENEHFSALYAQTQETLGFIRQSFHDIYSVKLAETENVQKTISILRIFINLSQLVLILIALGYCIKFYRKVVEGISISLSMLTQFVKGIRENPASQAHIRIKTGDEIEILADSFNDMLDMINAQIAKLEDDSKMREQLAEAELENLRITGALQNSELKFLQSRINPHFLFNTLNMIIKTADMEQASATSTLLETTAELLRYNLSRLTAPVTLKDELENIKNYITIQLNRFGDLINFQFDVDDTCLPQKVPAMILQPLVENAVTHGVGKLVEGGAVTIRLYQKPGRCCLEVEDGGAGVQPEKLEELNQMFRDPDGRSSHIGLNNVCQRLMLFFKGDVNFALDSRAGSTLVYIDMPERG